MSSSAHKPTHVSESMADRKRAREQAAARQSGQAAPEIDVKTNAVINPHNPEFITKRPWYLGTDEHEGPSLDHQASIKKEEHRSLAKSEELLKRQRLKQKQDQKFKVGMWVEALKRGRKPYKICKILKITKGKLLDLEFEDGSVEQKVKLDKVRMTKLGSRSVEVDAGEFGKETYDSKRDAYHGFEITAAHTRRLQEKYEKRDALRRQAKLKLQQEQQKGDNAESRQKNYSDSDSDSDIDSDVGSDSDDEFVQRDEDAKTFTSRLARQGGVGGAQMKVTARNLRIREDTAKYLRNLDPNSAYYDPKSRSMRDNPNPNVPTEELVFAGDNFARISGDAVELADTQLFAWDAQRKSDSLKDIHPQANPSQAELLKKDFKTKSSQLQAERKKQVLAKYGGAEYLDGKDGLGSAADKQGSNENQVKATRFGVSVTSEQYTRDGRLIKGGVVVKRIPLNSKYDEDVFKNGHTAVWGSYFHKGAFRWGYADDHSLLKNSYGTGENGRIANDAAHAQQYGTGVAGSAALAQAREMLKAIPTSERQGGNAPNRVSTLYGEANPNAILDPQKVQEALQKQSQDPSDSKKRKYNSLDAQVDVTEEEMEAYRLQKSRGEDDPMAKLASDELLEYK